MSHDLLQARIIHISDTHFGPGHRFQGRVTPDGSTTSRIGIPSLGDSILADLDGPAFTGKEWRQQLSPYPLLVAITGDLTQGGQEDELAEAERFIRAFDGRAVLDTRLALSDVAFVPGNHDLIWDAPTPVQRWALYCEFDRRLRGSATSAGESRALTRVTCRPERRMIVAEINSAFYVEKGKIGTFRGEVDDATLSKLRRELEEIPEAQRAASLKVALVHHHPVVLPGLAEAKRGYDGIANATMLLSLLRKYGFHLVLHGHKHTPHTFSFDADSAWRTEPEHQLFVAAGGSAGVEPSELPVADPGATNTYNAILLKWNHRLRHGRVRVVTRGLVSHDADRQPLEGQAWHWTTLAIKDRLLGGTHDLPAPSRTSRRYMPADDKADTARTGEYERLRHNMPVVEVRPSLDPDQAYEVVAWLVAHRPEYRVLPDVVEWSAGHKFEAVVTCDRSSAPTYPASFSYFGGMMLLVRMCFGDRWESATLYVRKPDTDGGPGVAAQPQPDTRPTTPARKPARKPGGKRTAKVAAAAPSARKPSKARAKPKPRRGG